MLIAKHMVEKPGETGFRVRVFSVESDFGRIGVGLDEIRFEGLEINVLFPIWRILVFRQSWSDPVLNTDAKDPAIFSIARANFKRSDCEDIV